MVNKDYQYHVVSGAVQTQVPVCPYTTGGYDDNWLTYGRERTLDTLQHVSLDKRVRTSDTGQRSIFSSRRQMLASHL